MRKITFTPPEEFVNEADFALHHFFYARYIAKDKQMESEAWKTIKHYVKQFFNF